MKKTMSLFLLLMFGLPNAIFAQQSEGGLVRSDRYTHAVFKNGVSISFFEGKSQAVTLLVTTPTYDVNSRRVAIPKGSTVECTAKAPEYLNSTRLAVDCHRLNLHNQSVEIDASLYDVQGGYGVPAKNIKGILRIGHATTVIMKLRYDLEIRESSAF